MKCKKFNTKLTTLKGKSIAFKNRLQCLSISTKIVIFIVLVGILLLIYSVACGIFNRYKNVTRSELEIHTDFFEFLPSTLPEATENTSTYIEASNILPVIGSIIQFGDHNWLVLDVQDDKALIISKDFFVPHLHDYDTDILIITWETSILRKYLNNEFLHIFSDKQQGRIVETFVINNDNLWFGTDGGNNTNDKIFLLSLEEVDKYFGNSGDYQNIRKKNIRKIASDDDGWFLTNAHDRERIIKYKNYAHWWWLRSPGYDSSRAAFVHENGAVNVFGRNVEIQNGGIRPALWLKMQ